MRQHELHGEARIRIVKLTTEGALQLTHSVTECLRGAHGRSAISAECHMILDNDPARLRTIARRA